MHKELLRKVRTPLDEAETKVYRRKARGFLLVEIIIVVILQLIGLVEMALVGATALGVLGIMLVLGKPKAIKNN